MNLRRVARSAVPGLPEGHEIFARAAARATEIGLEYAGAVTPVEAWALLQAQLATLVDVRTAAEYRFVGRVPGTVHVEWTGGEVQQRAAFVQNLRTIARTDQALLLLCRSGVRSHAAAVAATEAGFKRGYNVLEGFEGRIDPTHQRGNLDGWRFHRLPWVQD